MHINLFSHMTSHLFIHNLTLFMNLYKQLLYFKTILFTLSKNLNK